VSALKSFFSPGYPRNIWHLLLLITALFATLFTIADMVVLAFFIKIDLTDLLSFPGLVVLGLFVVALLAFFCLLKTSGIVRYWASFLWLGFFLLSTGFTILPATYVPAGYSSSYSITFQLFYLLGNVLLLVFFWNLGNLDRRILAPLFLIFTLLFGTLFFLDPGWNTADVGLKFGCTVGFIIYSVFYSLFAIMAVNSNKLLKLPGFRWLFAGFSFFLFSWVVTALIDFYFENYVDMFAPLMFFLILISPVLLTVGASLFTLKMDPLELEKRLRRASPAKEVESADQKV